MTPATDVDPLPLFGVEEEFLVVDPVTRELVARAADVLAPARASLESRVAGEITKTQVETRTEPCSDVATLYDQLLDGRRRLDTAAREVGLRVVATGTPVLGPMDPAPITEGARQDQGNATFRGLHDELAICALHVHVELPDRDQAVLVGNHLRPYLPTLIALAANSPYWNERDTGYGSWRTMIWQRWPVAGPPPYVTSAADYDRAVALLHRAGALVDEATIFWDIRPSAHLPTLEIRVSDVPTGAHESALLAALVRGLVVDARRRVEAGDPGPVVPAEVLRLAYWRAARDGLAGSGLDPLTGVALPAAELAERVWRIAAPTLRAPGEAERLRGWYERLLHADGASRQRAAAGPTGQLTAVVDDLLDRTVGAADDEESKPA